MTFLKNKWRQKLMVPRSSICVAYTWAPAGRGKGGHLPPLEFEKMTSYAAVLQNTLKFSLAPSALAIDTLYFSPKRRKKTQKFSFAPSARRKMVIFCTARRKRVNFFKCRWLCPPLEKFLRAPMVELLLVYCGDARHI